MSQSKREEGHVYGCITQARWQALQEGGPAGVAASGRGRSGAETLCAAGGAPLAPLLHVPRHALLERQEEHPRLLQTHSHSACAVRHTMSSSHRASCRLPSTSRWILLARWLSQKRVHSSYYPLHNNP